MMSADKKYAGNFTPAESIDESAFTAHAFATRKSFLINPPAKAGIRSDANWRHALCAAAGGLLQEALRNVTSASEQILTIDRFSNRGLPIVSDLRGDVRAPCGKRQRRLLNMAALLLPL
jgi:hypothetical protein